MGQNTVGVAPAVAVAGGMAFGDALASVNQALKEPTPAQDHEGPPTVPTNMDFGLDLDLPTGLADAQTPVAQPLPDVMAPQPSEQDFASLAQWDAPAPAPAADNSLNLDLDDLASFSLSAAQAPAVAEPAATPSPADTLNALEFDLDSFAPPQAKVEASPADLELSLAGDDVTRQLPVDADAGNSHASAASQAEPEPVFDLSGLSLDLGTSPEAAMAPAAATPSMPEDPMATKLALAEEFNAIGDSDGARTLIEEVIAEAHGDLKAKAQALLSQIG